MRLLYKGEVIGGEAPKLVYSYLWPNSWTKIHGGYYCQNSDFSLDTSEDKNYLLVIDVQNEINGDQNLDEWNKHGVQAVGMSPTKIVFRARSLPTKPIKMKIYIIEAEQAE